MGLRTSKSALIKLSFLYKDTIDNTLEWGLSPITTTFMKIAKPQESSEDLTHTRDAVCFSLFFTLIVPIIPLVTAIYLTLAVTAIALMIASMSLTYPLAGLWDCINPAVNAGNTVRQEGEPEGERSDQGELSL